MSDPTAVAAGWYPDASGQPRQRWWDGAAWTTWVSIDGQVEDESLTAAAASTATPPAATVPMATAPATGQTPGWQRLAAQPYLFYHEREPARVGGRIDILGPDGALLGMAEGDQKSGTFGAFGKEIAIHLRDADGVHLGTLVRKTNLKGETHPVLDATGTTVGEFVGSMVTTRCTLNTAHGSFVLGLHHKENLLTDSAGQAIVRIVHAENFHAVESITFNGFRQTWNEDNPDTFVLEPLVQLPPSLLLFALLAPIESNIRVDTSRVT